LSSATFFGALNGAHRGSAGSVYVSYDARDVEARPRLYPVGALLTMTAADGFVSHMPLPFAGATGWFCDEGPARRLPKLNFSIQEEMASDQ
jgi:hypothetical protein